MKKLSLLVLTLCVIISGCGKKNVQADFEAFSQRVENSCISFTANIRAEYENKTARFTLGYEESGEGGTVTVLAPELIKGIKAHVSPGSTSLEYESIVLDTGALDNFGLSPLSSLPHLVQAMRRGHMDSFWEEDEALVLQLQSEDELKCTVWFKKEGMIPLRAELSSGGRVTVFVEIDHWNEG